MAKEEEREAYLRNRIEDISQLIYELAIGNFDYRLEIRDHEDDIEGLVGGINMLGEELKASTVSRDFMESIYRGVVDILIILKPDLTIDRLNEAVIHHLGYSPEDLEGRRFRELIKKDDFRKLVRIKQGLADHGAHYNAELRLMKKNGDYLETSASFSHLYDNRQRHLGTIVIAKDISFIKQKEKELKIAKERAEAANKEKSRFLANMSHEIRTPLNGMLGFVELLRDMSSEPQQAKYLDLIKVSGETLSKLLNDILDINKVEQGKLALEQIPFDLKDSIDTNFAPYKYLANEKGLKLKLSFQEGLPKQVIGDPSRLNQVIRNLIGNALKFTETGYISLDVRFEQLEEEWADIFIHITDTGIGIPEDKKELVFESFTQADTSTTRKYGGSGLGLTITKHLIKLMNGKIQVESPPISKGLSQGSLFSLQIPMKIATWINNSKPVPADLTDFKLDKDYQVLIVDDNAINLLLLQKMLESLNLSVSLARNGQEAIDKASAEPYDIIFMDVQMPILDGYEATMQLRNEGYSGPIIAVTANVYQEDIQKCYDSGMDSHLKKPIKKTDLIEKIAAFRDKDPFENKP